MRSRCAWCTAWTSGSVCDRCTAEVLPQEQFGAARMLVDAGVDRLALSERVRALSRNQFVALSSRFDAQWSILQKRVDETRFIESSLLQRGFREMVEDSLIASIPIHDERLKTFTDAPRTDDLESIFVNSPVPMNRALAAIALLRRRSPSPTRKAFEDALMALHSWQAIVAREAALALTQWYLRELRDLPWLGRWDLSTIGEVVRPLLSDATLGPHAALALKAASDDAGLDDQLRTGLASADPELRFACALALRDEGELGRALDSGDALKAEVARRTLGRFRSRLLHRRLAEDGDDVKLEMIKSLGHPPEPELVEALLAGAEHARADVRAAAMRYLYSGSVREIPAESRPAIAEFLARAELAPETVLKSLDWASDDVAPFAEAATSMLEGLDTSELAKVIEEHRWDLRRWFSSAKGDREARLLDRWAKHAEVAEAVLHLALDGEAFDLLIGVWDRFGDDKATLVAPLAAAVAKHSSSRAKEALVPAFWSRFKRAPNAVTRAQLMTVMKPFRYELKELRSLEPRGGPFGSRDLARFYETYALADPLEAPSLVSEVLEQAQQERGEAKRDYPHLAPLADVAFAHATSLASTRPCTALRIAANVASHVVNAYRADYENALLSAAVAKIRAHHPALMNAVDNATPIDPAEARYSSLIEQIDVELRLAREAEERLLEAKRREEEYAAREAQRIARENVAREAEQIARENAAREAAERQAAAQQAAMQSAQMRPNVASDGLDDEIMLSGQPLRTLREYVAFMKAISAGGDALAIMSAHGLTPESWGACAGAWSALFQQRPNLAMRFAQLLQATWS